MYVSLCYYLCGNFLRYKSAEVHKKNENHRKEFDFPFLNLKENIILLFYFILHAYMFNMCFIYCKGLSQTVSDKRGFTFFKELEYYSFMECTFNIHLVKMAKFVKCV